MENKLPFLTIFTPAYNRANTLERLYDSLKAQTCMDFEWIIIDDGSTDNTVEIVKPWLQEVLFPVRYYYKQNGGLHTTYNLAIEKMDNSVLAVCIDSDDYMPDNAVELIKELWQKKGSDKYGGIVGLDYDMEHNLIGGKLPDNEVDAVKLALGILPIVKGDKKYVCRTDLYKATGPQPTFEGERYFNPSWRNKEVARCRNMFLSLNEEICTVDYQPGGLSKNKFKQYINSPNGYMTIRKQLLSFKCLPLKKKIKTVIHYDSEAILAKKWLSEYKVTDEKLLMILCLPLGCAFMLFTKIKGR